ncbi:phosphatidylserine decarboxylase [Dethiosulfatarculus sandiegensis]|uniref:Phosphatidylserine decarboxylase n=1 Tax=Dethiosulfatarculus sandiegensis TaxID=1429043 RepID=A0A0D2JT08_9BACT|nr:phosphatidylserine decarboxylase [Dethiosulfatarculus sandiegensis]KIX12600.1 phosphatidylserine decarboxylase [Dethiosulfatarculus sandiegensis]
MKQPGRHQYIDRRTGKVCDEKLFADKMVNFLYSEVRENAPFVFKSLTSSRASSFLGYLNFEALLGTRLATPKRLLRQWGVDTAECLDDPASLNSPEKVFTRKICYWECRPMPSEPGLVVSPADSRVLLGSFKDDSLLFVKDKFFSINELLGELKGRWIKAFDQGDFAVFRLTPDKYHYVHTPVAGRVVDIYEVEGAYHSCNPAAVVNLVTPYSKNKRVVTVIDTDVPGGTGVGLVAMVEVVALMVGEVLQCYSRQAYDDPWPVVPGSFLLKGRPKSLFKPGSSTVIVICQKDRVRFDQDLIDNLNKPSTVSRFSHGFGKPLVETDIKVRARVGSSVLA